MPDDLETARGELAEAAHETAARGLVNGTSGNLSVRVGRRILITPRRAHLGSLEPGSCVEVRIEDGSVVHDRRHDNEPSSETPLHLSAYRVSGAGAVVHTHSLFATAVATVFDELPPVHYMLAAFGGSLQVVPYARFGSDELAATVGEALRERHAALLRNHGAVVFAENVKRAVDLAELLEWLARLYATTRSLGSPALLEEGELKYVAERSAALRYGLTETPK